MRIKAEPSSDWLQVITLAGELDAYTAPKLAEAITETLDRGLSWVVVDMRQVDYIDSVALGILIGGVKRAGERNGDLAVVCARPNVRRVFEVSGTAELLNVGEEMVAAIEILAAERAARGGCATRVEEGAQQ